MTPWFSVWFHPRRTIRQIVDTNPKQSVLLLPALSGALELFLYDVLTPSPKEIPIILALLMTLAGGALLGLVGLFVMGWLYRWVGNEFGGRANNGQVRAAMAWAEIPKLVLFAFWIVLMIVTQGNLLKIWQGQQVLPSPLLQIGLLFTLAAGVLFIWHLVVLCKMVAEVHRFSSWTGFGTVLIPNASIYVVIFYTSMLAGIMSPDLSRGSASPSSDQQAISSGLSGFSSTQNP